MKRRKLGTLEVSEMGFGCMNASGNYGPASSLIAAGQPQGKGSLPLLRVRTRGVASSTETFVTTLSHPVDRAVCVG
jgi:hypothetical protein